MTADEDRSARLVLSVIGEPGDPRLTSLVAELGPVVVLDALRDQSRRSSLAAGLAERLRAARPDDVLEAAGRRGIRFVTPGDPEWPTGLDDLALAPFLHERGGVPVALWVRGPLQLD
ncbi:MAG: DNA-protecting protein DprA, partial [Marmoricola sp.]